MSQWVKKERQLSYLHRRVRGDSRQNFIADILPDVRKHVSVPAIPWIKSKKWAQAFKEERRKRVLHLRRVKWARPDRDPVSTSTEELSYEMRTSENFGKIISYVYELSSKYQIATAMAMLKQYEGKCRMQWAKKICPTRTNWSKVYDKTNSKCKCRNSKRARKRKGWTDSSEINEKKLGWNTYTAKIDNWDMEVNCVREKLGKSMGRWSGCDCKL